MFQSTPGASAGETLKTPNGRHSQSSFNPHPARAPGEFATGAGAEVYGTPVSIHTRRERRVRLPRRILCILFGGVSIHTRRERR